SLEQPALDLGQRTAGEKALEYEGADEADGDDDADDRFHLRSPGWGPTRWRDDTKNACSRACNGGRRGAFRRSALRVRAARLFLRSLRRLRLAVVLSVLHVRLSRWGWWISVREAGRMTQFGAFLSYRRSSRRLAIGATVIMIVVATVAQGC